MDTLLGFPCLCFTLCGPSLLHVMVSFSASRYGVLLCFTLCCPSLLHVMVSFSASHYVGPSLLCFTLCGPSLLCFTLCGPSLLCFTLCGPSLLHIMWSFSASHYVVLFCFTLCGPSLLHISLGTLLGFLGLCFTLCGPSLLHIMLVLLFSASHYGGPSLLCFTLCWSFSSLLHIMLVLLFSASHYGGPSLLHIMLVLLFSASHYCGSSFFFFSFWGEEDLYTTVCSHMGLTGETESLRLNYYSVWKALARKWTITQCLKTNKQQNVSWKVIITL